MIQEQKTLIKNQDTLVMSGQQYMHEIVKEWADFAPDKTLEEYARYEVNDIYPTDILRVTNELRIVKHWSGKNVGKGAEYKVTYRDVGSNVKKECSLWE